MAGIFDWLFGQNGLQKVDTLNGGQNQLLQQLLQMLSPQGSLGQAQGQSTDYLKQLMDPSSEAVNQFTAPHIQQFNQQTIPGISERFAGAGANGGALSSSGFGQALGTAGGNLQTQLAALKAGLGQQAAGQLMNQYGSQQGRALGTQSFGYTAPQQGFLPSLANSWAGGGFQGGGDLLKLLTSLGAGG